ncbi:MAG: hypothetical protein M3209_01245 [Acidobacteriota bacterium]|nr:hypothetical protein [Acidobacteriota bacterium]
MSPKREGIIGGRLSPYLPNVDDEAGVDGLVLASVIKHSSLKMVVRYVHP